VPEFVKLSLPAEGEPRRFHYLQDAFERDAAVKIFEGELRPTFETKAGDGFYHLIAIDIYKEPDHNILKDLLTRDAMQMFMRKTTEDGVLCFHVSSRHYDLVPIIASAAKDLKYACLVGRYYDHDVAPGAYASEWVIVARKEAHLTHLNAPPGYAKKVKEPYWIAPPLVDRFYVWTDKGAKSLRGVYRSDPDIDRLRNFIGDLRFEIGDGLGLNPRDVYESTRWIDNLFSAWTLANAGRLNRGAPMAKSEKK
jgi:hypothetical protein